MCLQKVAAPTRCCRRDLCSAIKRCFLSSSVGLLVANYRRLIPTLRLLSDGSRTADSSTSLQAQFWNCLHLLDCVPVPAYFPCLTFIYSIPLWGLLLLASWHAQEAACYKFLLPVHAQQALAQDGTDTVLFLRAVKSVLSTKCLWHFLKL